MYKEQNGNVVLTEWLGVVNRINEGNPNFTPYVLPPETQTRP